MSDIKPQKRSSARRTRRFKRISNFVEKQVRSMAERRGFALSRLLTRWAEIVGKDIAATCRPVKVKYGAKALGGTLVILSTGAQAQMLQMQVPLLRQKVNACYGYNAIERIQIIQTAPTGFADGQAIFMPAPPPKGPKSLQNKPQIRASATRLAQNVQDQALRAALTALGENVISKEKSI